MFRAIAKFSVRFRWPIIVFWVIMVPISASVFPTLDSVTKNSTEGFLPNNSQTHTAYKLETAAFQKKDTAGNAVLVASRSGGKLTDQDNLALKNLVEKIKDTKEITEVHDLGVSADGQAHEYSIGVSGAAFGNKIFDIIDNLRSSIHGVKLPNGLKTNLTGDIAAQVDQDKANNAGRNKTEIYSVILILVLLLLVFRSILAPIVTLLPAGLALAISQPVIAESTKAGVQVGFITQIMLIVLLLGAGTDYGLFLVFRVREEMRRKGLTAKQAVVEALTHVGESITFSALTVIAALLCLLFAVFGLYSGLGPALAIGLFIMLLIALTFLPALISILGRAVFWPTKTSKREIKVGLWGRLADKAIKRPILVLCLGLVVFGALGSGLLGYKAAGFGQASAPSGSDSAAGQEVIERHFPAANNNPQLVIFKFKQSVWKNPQPVARAESELSSSSSFKAVSGPLDANGFNLTPEQLVRVHGSGTPAEAALSQFISKDGQTVQYYAILSAGETGSPEALQAVPSVRNVVDKIGMDVGAVQSSLYSQDSVAYDINQTTNRDLKRIIPIVLLVIAALLAILLRSLVAPWYLIVTVGLGYVASLGLSMYVFVHLLGHGGINFVLPFLMFVFGMALGQDYNILVMSRIREEAHHSDSLFAAITKAVGITGTTVTSAGLILAGTFSIFGIVGGNEQGEQIGFGVAFAILLDTFFVRTLLVPSIVALLGKWNWWPSKLSSK